MHTEVSLEEDSQRLGQPTPMDIFVHRPVLAIVLSLFLVLLGIYAASKLPILQFPRIESASLVITTAYVGASAEVVQGFITEPIERVAASVPGIDFIDSTTVAGLSTVRVWLNLNEDITAALAELSTRLDQIRSELPQEARDPSIQVVRTDSPIATFYLDAIYDTDQGMSRSEATDYLSRRVLPTLATITDVQRVGMEGDRAPAMRIWLDEKKMTAFNISAEEASQALRANNLIATVGRSENAMQRVDLLTDTALTEVADFKNLIVRDQQDAQIRLSDIARVELSEVEGAITTRISNDTVIFLSIWPLPGANEIEIGNELYVMLDELNATMPKGLSIGIGYDGTAYMRSSLKEIFITLIETVLLVGLVVVLMMGSLRTALVPLITIPISLLGAAAAMHLLGFSLNLLTILAIVLSVGLVVDDAIVVVENVARHMRGGMNRIDAALSSSRQLLSPIISMTVTLAAVYLPIGLLTGLTGALFTEFAFTLAIAVMVSGLVALTLSPIMSAYACPKGGEENGFTRKINRGFSRLQHRYGKVLLRTIEWQPQVLGVAIFLAVLTVPFYLFAAKELAPIEDQDQIGVVVTSAPEASLDYSIEHMDDVVNRLLTLEGTKYVWQLIYPNGAYSGMELVPQNERGQNLDSLFTQSFGLLSDIPGLSAFPVLSPPLPTAGNFSVEMVVLSTDTYAEMKPYADRLVGAAFGSQKFLYADTDLKIDLPQVRFQMDRERIANLGMNLEDVSAQLSTLLAGEYVNLVNLNGRAYQVIPMIEREGRLDPNLLLDLSIRTPQGELVPLRSVASIATETAPRNLSKFQQKNAFRVYGETIPGVTKAQALSALEAAAADILPADYQIDYAGESRQVRAEGNTLQGALLIALIFVFLVLVIQFNSFRDPMVVLLGSVPLALSGAMMLAFLDLTTINIYSQVGFITLVGLISKNGILIVEFANKMQAQGFSKLDAIKQAGETRLRPVLMTTGATALGHFPLVLVTGAGAEARNSIGIILVAGMVIGTLFTLFVLPSVYLALASDHRPMPDTQPDAAQQPNAAQQLAIA